MNRANGKPRTACPVNRAKAKRPALADTGAKMWDTKVSTGRSQGGFAPGVKGESLGRPLSLIGVAQMSKLQTG